MRSLVIIAILLAGAGIAALVLMRPVSDGLEQYPHAYIAAPGYDVTAITYVRAQLEQPPVAPPGMQTAWVCNDPAFHDAQGRPWLFPVADSKDKPVLPTHPVLKRRPDIERCGIFRSPEAQQLLTAYRAAQGK